MGAAHGWRRANGLASSRTSLAVLALAALLAAGAGWRGTARDATRCSAPWRATASVNHAAPFVHGGRAHDYTGFDPLVQLPAARDIGALQLNDSGSTGLGHRSLSSPTATCAASTPTATCAASTPTLPTRRWVVDSGLADLSSGTIVLASWGGYLALGAASALGEPDAA